MKGISRVAGLAGLGLGFIGGYAWANKGQIQITPVLQMAAMTSMPDQSLVSQLRTFKHQVFFG